MAVKFCGISFFIRMKAIDLPVGSFGMINGSMVLNLLSINPWRCEGNEIPWYEG